jgi:hypothetical protein
MAKRVQTVCNSCKRGTNSAIAELGRRQGKLRANITHRRCGRGRAGVHTQLPCVRAQAEPARSRHLNAQKLLRRACGSSNCTALSSTVPFCLTSHSTGLVQAVANSASMTRPAIPIAIGVALAL